MKNIFLFGECMVELMQTSPNTMQQSFAGDVFNTAVYLKRSFADVKTYLVTALGKDQFSLDMLDYFHKENIDTGFVFQSENKIPGLYSIKTDRTGERSFTYWRDNSAAREVMTYIDQEIMLQLSKGDMFFFSGISLAVIQPQDRELFWRFIEQLKSAGVQIVFDPNYRARMWDTKAQAQVQFELAFTNSDIALPGVDDFAQLYGFTSAEQVHNFCKQFNLKELLIKNGEQGILCEVDGQVYHFNIEPVQNVVDTTSAGDSFNGLYLGARSQDFNVSDSVELASRAAGFVIQHKGAIVPTEEFQNFINQQLLLAE